MDAQPTGSAAAIAFALGKNTSEAYQHPCDPEDFQNCVHYLKTNNVTQEQFTELMKNVSPQWNKLTTHWSMLVDTLEQETSTQGTITPKTYRKLQGVLNK